MGALLLQKYETRICLCTQWIAMLCGSVTCQIRLSLQHMHSFLECQWKLLHLLQRDLQLSIKCNAESYNILYLACM